MQILNIHLNVPPEKHNDIVRILRLSAGPTKAQKGCKDFTYYQNIQNGNVIYIQEIWDSSKAFERHLNSDEFANILEAFEQASTPPRVDIHQIASTSGLEFVERIRKQASTDTKP